MKLGIMIESQEGVGWKEWKDIVQWTEELGFESLWRSDHFFPFFNRNRNTADSLDTLIAHTYTAMASRRIRFGPLVLSMTFRHPAVLARMAAAIDQLSEGRFILGLGAGWNVPEHEAYGIELPPLKQRMDGLEDGVRIIKAMFENETSTYEGSRYHVKEAPMSPKPYQQPAPLLIGGGGEQRTLRIVARYATEWNVPGGLGLERYRDKVKVLEAHCEAEQRDPKTIDRSLMYGYITGESQAEIERKVAAAIERMPAQFRPQPGERSPRLGLVGTASQIVEQIKEAEAEGVSRIMLQHTTPPLRDEIEFLAREILPKV